MAHGFQVVLWFGIPLGFDIGARLRKGLEIHSKTVEVSTKKGGLQCCRNWKMSATRWTR